jgi:hypothetical protein
VVDYRVYYDEGITGGDYVAMESNILGQQYTAHLLTAGIYYRFKISARNVIGYSSLSDFV